MVSALTYLLMAIFVATDRFVESASTIIMEFHTFLHVFWRENKMTHTETTNLTPAKNILKTRKNGYPSTHSN